MRRMEERETLSSPIILCFSLVLRVSSLSWFSIEKKCMIVVKEMKEEETLHCSVQLFRFWRDTEGSMNRDGLEET
jgi:hypothetical protein